MPDHHTTTPVVLDPQSILSHPWLGTRSDWAWGFTILHAFRDPAGVVDLAEARSATRESIPEDAWWNLIARLTRDGLLTLRGLTPHLHPLPRTTSSSFQAAWHAFETNVPALRARTIAAYRSEAARALEDAGFTVEQDARVPAGAKKDVPVHLLAHLGEESAALNCCGARALETTAKKLQGVTMERAYALLHPSNQLVDVRTIEIQQKTKLEPETIALPPNVPREAWVKWVKYRRERGKAPTRHSITAHLKILEAAGAGAAAVIERSINSSWVGLFLPEKTHQDVVPRGTASPAAPRFQTGETVLVELEGGASRVVTAEVVSSHYIVDEHGATYPIDRVRPHQEFRAAS